MDTNAVLPRPKSLEGEIYGGSANFSERHERFNKTLTRYTTTIALLGVICTGLIKGGPMGMEYLSAIANAVKDTYNRTSLESVDGTVARPEDSSTNNDFAKGRVIVKRLVRTGYQMDDVGYSCQMSRTEFRTLNRRIKNPNKIIAGQTVLLTPARGQYVVEKSGRLDKTADECAVSLDELLEANGLTENYAPKGKVLDIPFHVSNVNRGKRF